MFFFTVVNLKIRYHFIVLIEAETFDDFVIGTILRTDFCFSIKNSSSMTQYHHHRWMRCRMDGMSHFPFGENNFHHRFHCSK